MGLAFRHLVHLSNQKDLTINREILFDVAIAGPIAGLVIAVIVSIYGAYTAPILDQDIAAELFTESRLMEWSSRRAVVDVCKFSDIWQGWNWT